MTLARRTASFLEQTKKNRPDIAVLGEYEGSNKKLLVRGDCAHEWNTTPNNLRIGVGCPICFGKRLAKKLTYTDDQYKAKLASINENYTTSDVYEKSTTHMTFHCAMHDHIWSMRAGHVKHDSCKICRSATKADSIRTIMEEANPHVVLTTQYVDYSTPLEWKCTIDGYTASSKPSTLKTGKAVCPLCELRKSAIVMWEQVIAINPGLMLLDAPESPDDPVYVRHVDGADSWEDTIRALLKKQKRRSRMKK